MSEQLSFFAAFLAGLASFFSPCILPLIPVYLSFITGLSIDKLTDAKPKKILREIVLFVLGFSFIFVALGASATSIGNFIIKNQRILEIVGGIVIILFGLHIAGLFKIKFLEYEKKIHLKSKPMHIFGSFIIGMTFAVGWTPCIGPILGTILTFAATRDTLYEGMLLLSCYSIGLAIPFLLIGLAINKFLNLFSKLKKHLKIISIISGILLITVGILLITGSFRR